MGSTDASQSTAERPNRRMDLGIVGALVQSSFLIQEIVGEIAGEYELSIIQARMLGVLSDREPRMAHLAQLLGLSKQSATGLVDRAERRGLVRRLSIPVGDERAVHVTLTGAGRELAEQVTGAIAARVSAAAADLSETDRTRLSTLLSDVVVSDADRHGKDISAPLMAPR
jgi:DNA-binding MarR family transcriptional regulator